MSKRNRYSKALKQLKSTQIDEKIRCLDESLPTNHTKGMYALNPPGFRVGIPDPPKTFYPDVDGNWPEGIPGTPGELTYERPQGYWSGERDWDTLVTSDFSQDYLVNDPTGKSTAGLIADDGTVLAGLPPGGESFILGPLVDGWVQNHTTDAYTTIGYLQKDTRQFVLLAQIYGQWKEDLHGSGYAVWDGVTLDPGYQPGQIRMGFKSENENFTLAMAQWMRQQMLDNNYADNIPYFNPGGVPQPPMPPDDCPNCPDGMKGGHGFSPSNFGSGGEPDIGTAQGPPGSGDATDAGYPSWGPMGGLGDLIDGLFGSGDDDDDLGDLINGIIGAFGDRIIKPLITSLKSPPPKPPKPPKPPTDPPEPPDQPGPDSTKEYWDYIKSLTAKPPGTLTDKEKKVLIAAGLDDFAVGGETASPLGDFALMGATAIAIKGSLAAGLTGLGLVASSTLTAALGSLGSDLTGDANDSGDYNKQLATKLTTSIISGKHQEIKLSDKAAKDQIDNLNPEAVSDIITIGGKAHNPSAETTVNPTQGTKGPLFGDSGWGTQGASEIHYDPKTDTLTITSEKTLRTGLEGDKFDITQGGEVSGGQVLDPGKQTAFGDIPSPSPEKVEKIASNLLKNVAVDYSLGGMGNVFNAVTGNIVGESPWDQIKNDPERMEKFENDLSSAANDIATGTVQGTASNSVALRKALTDLGMPQSEVEKIGGAFGQVSSQTNYSGDQIPANIRAVINSKTNKESFSYRKLRKVKFIIESASSELKAVADNIAGEIIDKKGPEVAKKVADVLKDYDSGKIKTKDQIVELVIGEFDRLRLEEGMTSKGFEYLYGLAVSNVVSQYGIDSKFASDLLHASADTTDYEFGPNFPGSYINSVGDHQVDSSRRVNINAYYDSKYGSVSGSGSNYTFRTLDGTTGATVGQLNSALGITLPSGMPNGSLTGTPKEGSAIERVFTRAEPGNMINFSWGFASSELGLSQGVKVDDYAFVAISGNTTKIVSILRNGDTRSGMFKYRLEPGDIDGNGNVRVAVGVIDVHDTIYDSKFQISNFGSLYAGDVGSAGDTTDGIDLGTSVDSLDPNKRKRGDTQIASHDRPFSKYPPAGGSDKWPGLPADKMDLLHPSNKPLINTPLNPYKKASGTDTQIAGYHQSGGAGYGNPEKIDWGPGGGRKNSPGPGARPNPAGPPIKKAGGSDTQIAQTTGAPAPGYGNPYRIDWGTGGGRKNSPGPGARPNPAGPPIKKAKTKKQPQYAHYEPQGRVITESSFTPRQRKILREVKKPIEVKEAPKKYKMNFAGKYSSQNTPDKTASAVSDGLVASGNAKGQKWRIDDKYWQGYETTEKMNIIYDRVGHGSMAWERTIEEAQRKNSWRNREMQEQLNIHAHEKAMRKIDSNYQSPWGIEIVETTVENEKNFDKVNKIKQVVSQGTNKRIAAGKRDVAPEYPDEAPPEMINGYHPKLVNGQQISNIYNKLDPQSAKAMPKTGNPHIDAKVDKAKKEGKNKTIDAHYEPQGNPLMEKKNLEPKEHKSSGKGMKSFQQFFNPADVKPEYPDEAPPEMINGYHPKLVDDKEISNRYNKLDPQSAEAMPKTDNPHIDAKVEKAKNNPDKDGPAHRQNVFAKIKKARG